MVKSDFTRWQLPPFLWGVLILAINSYPRIEIPDVGFTAIDKVGHFCVYFMLGFLIVRALSKGEGLRLQGSILKTLVIGITFAIFDEVHQKFIPGRSAEFWDAAADVIGIAAALLAFYSIVQLQLKIKKSISSKTIFEQYYEK